MRFQSKYRTHSIVFKTTRRVLHPGAVSPDIVPGIIVEFKGPQRIFDSQEAQRLHNWSDETREEVENFVLKHKHYGNGIYLAPGQELPEDKLDIARVKPKALKRFCEAIGINSETGTVDQCQNEPTVGRRFCPEHDPDEVKITRGLSTTTD